MASYATQKRLRQAFFKCTTLFWHFLSNKGRENTAFAKLEMLLAFTRRRRRRRLWTKLSIERLWPPLEGHERVISEATGIFASLTECLLSAHGKIWQDFFVAFWFLLGKFHAKMDKFLAKIVEFRAKIVKLQAKTVKLEAKMVNF